jgi:hypothetical protein
MPVNMTAHHAPEAHSQEPAINVLDDASACLADVQHYKGTLPVGVYRHIGSRMRGIRADLLDLFAKAEAFGLLFEAVERSDELEPHHDLHGTKPEQVIEAMYAMRAALQKVKP